MCCCATATRVAGFLRVLQLLLDHPWSVRPLVVDPASELPAEDRRAVVQVHSVSCRDLL
jgi:Nrap protein PAP/OAS1-like domain 5